MAQNDANVAQNCKKGNIRFIVLDIVFLLSLPFYGIPWNLGIVAPVRTACTFRNFRVCFCKTLFWFRKASKMHEKTMQKAPKRHQNSENITPFDHFEHMMSIYAGLVTPKVKMLKKYWFPKQLVCKGSSGGRKSVQNPPQGGPARAHLLCTSSAPNPGGGSTRGVPLEDSQ